MGAAVILLKAEAERRVREAGEQAYPNECCGALIGVFGYDGIKTVEGIIPIQNTREVEEQYHRFQIESEDLMRVENEARSRKQDVLGFYHSHPDHPARPSLFDQDHALPFYSYVIVAVEQVRSTELTSWELTSDRTQFLEERIERFNEE
jgi:proteasome lid subunit RPN8/RPN11